MSTQPFLTLLKLQRARLDLSLEQLAERLGYKSHSYVAEVLQGRKVLPLEGVDPWADALGFAGEDRLELYRSAITDLAPIWFREMIERGEAESSQLQTKVREFEARIVQDWVKRGSDEDPAAQ